MRLDEQTGVIKKNCDLREDKPKQNRTDWTEVVWLGREEQPTVNRTNHTEVV